MAVRVSQPGHRASLALLLDAVADEWRERGLAHAEMLGVREAPGVLLRYPTEVAAEVNAVLPDDDR